MNAKVGYSTPMLHVAEIEKSIEFYERLGFQTIDTDGCQPIAWARLHCEGGAVMFLRAEEPMHTVEHSVMLYMYCADLEALRNQLVDAGVKVTPIRRPEYMPSGEVTLADPDGYPICIAHWSKAEQENWEKRVSKNQQD
jgi:catechol 2,3-dioxygenase-like lactoylglutathione lyase family enzyme